MPHQNVLFSGQSKRNATDSPSPSACLSQPTEPQFCVFPEASKQTPPNAGIGIRKSVEFNEKKELLKNYQKVDDILKLL